MYPRIHPFLIALLQQSQQNKVQNEQCGADPENGVDLLDLALADLDKDEEDEACSDTVGNAIAEPHEDACEECGNCLIEVAPIDILEGRHHHNTDNDQSRCGCRERNCTDEGCKECGDRKADGRQAF